MERYHMGKEDTAMLWLVHLSGLSRNSINALLSRFYYAADIWNLSEQDIGKDIIKEKQVEKLIQSRNPERLVQEVERLRALKVSFLSMHHESYPEGLKNIFDPPFGIFVKGMFPPASLPALSMIGARRCSEYGTAVALQLAEECAKRNLVIVSGMARGIDSYSHKGAIKGDGYTIAVLGSGLDICYPPEHFGLMQEIVKHGCVISEFPLGMAPHGGNFPKRNRIISGLSQATLVVEAAEKSGTMITVSQALENGRDVFAVPGNITNPNCTGTNRLIRDGCAAITCWQDIFFEMGIGHPSGEEPSQLKKEISTLAQEEKTVYDCIRLEPLFFDDLEKQSGCDAAALTYILTCLELRGLICALPGQRYIRAV